MIITRYLVSEIFKSQLYILCILLLIFFCQQLVRILGTVVDGNIPINLVFSLLSLSMAILAQLILPLSLFLGLLITLRRLYTESEITVMHACGLGKNVLIRATLVLSLITMFFAAINVIWLSPWASRHQEQVLSEAKANPSITTLISGQFQPVQNGNSVLFIGGVKGNEFQCIFLAQLKPDYNSHPSIIVADHGHISLREDGYQVITLDKGTHYEGTALLRDFRITEFIQYQALIGHHSASINNRNAEQMSIGKLWSSSELEARAELHWRLTLVVSVIIMALMVIPLSMVNPRQQGRMLNMLPAIILYLIFFLLQPSLHSNGAKGKLDPMIWMWFTNGIYLVIVLVLNYWDSWLVRRLRGKIYVIRVI